MRGCNPVGKRSLYLPLEIKAREFLPRLLLAGVFAKRGYRVYLGEKFPLNKAVKAKRERDGVYVYKSTRDRPDTEQILRKISLFCVLDEEIGIAVRSPEYWIRHRTGGIDRVDCYLTVSESIARLVRVIYPDFRGKIVATGWPKFDLWRQQFRGLCSKRALEIRSEFGEFILFSSDFGMISDERIRTETTRILRKGLPGADADGIISGFHTAKNDFELFVQDLHRYDAVSSAPLLIIRPHPAEDHYVWYQRTAGMQRVRVIYRGEITEWLESCTCLVHRGCTTAVQARFSNIPVYFWGSKLPSVLKQMLPFRVSTPIDSLVDLLDAQQDAGAKEPFDFGDELSAKEELSSEAIFRELDAFSIPLGHPLEIAPLLHARLWLTKFFYRAAWMLGLHRYRVFNFKKIRKLQGGLSAEEARESLSLMFSHPPAVVEVAPDLLLIEGGG